MVEHAQSKRTRRIGDVEVFPLSLGGNVFGWGADEARSFAILDAYTEAGGNFVDTADVYSAWVPGNSGGESETIIGNWLAARGRRDEMVIATKVGGGSPERRGLRAEVIKADVEASLRRLRTDYIDLYYTHYDDESLPVEDFLTTLDGLVRQGKVRQIAASNITAARLTEALDASEREGLARYVALQPHYNLVSRDTYEGELSRVAAERGLATVPYFALAAGFLTGKYRPGSTPEGSVRAESVQRYLDSERGPRVLAALDEVSAAHGGVEIATVALAWLAAQPTVVAPIASARTLEQLPSLLAVADLHLTASEIATLTEASA
ncbi:aldo/keto reductase [Streptomyces buecherae]|uniref:Aldo/keto reductase n=1 Tax=Streptomyces buecherae TaxID=2763006 RepID=A0A7H8NB16_9ACTN|nr:aldo/keto reductase [Streptomyces buecherae]QKW51546.1 aldo/keto reductase [Streptomyces buecherae]